MTAYEKTVVNIPLDTNQAFSGRLYDLVKCQGRDFDARKIVLKATFLETTVVKIDWIVLPAQFDDDDDDLDLVQRLMNPDEVSGL